MCNLEQTVYAALQSADAAFCIAALPMQPQCSTRPTALSFDGSVVHQSLSAAQNSDATNHANIVTIGAYGAMASVQPLAGMHYPRAYCTSVVLPDGKVLTMGGQVGFKAGWHRLPQKCDTRVILQRRLS